MTGDGPVVFDENKLRAFATELRQLESPELLRTKLMNALVPETVFGGVDGAPNAATSLGQTMNSLLDSLARIGVDTEELASNALAAADQAVTASRMTEQGARGGRR